MAQEKNKKDYGYDVANDELAWDFDETLYARHAEIESFEDLQKQRGTPIPALFNQLYKFIQNPSTVSVETYKRMIDTDDTVGSGVDFLSTCLVARLGRYQHPNKEISQWINDRLKEIEGGWLNNVKELFSASWAGFAIKEKVWANTKNGFVIQKMPALPPATVLFETERTGEITSDGILQYQRNYNPMMGSGMGYFGGAFQTGLGFNTDALRPDMFAKFGDMPFPLRTANTYSYLSIRIPRLKCVHYAFDAQGKFGNPYGRSLLRRAYKYYVMKDVILQMLAVALDRKGTPLTIIYADPSTTLIDPEKKGTTSAKGRKVGIRADEAARDAFKNIHNDSFIVLPGKKGQIYDTDFVPQDPHADQFIQSLEFCNKSILRALLIPALIFSSGDGTGSYALGQEHAKTFDKILDGTLDGLCQVLLHEVVKEMIAYNFPREMWENEGLGEFSRRELTMDEKDKEAALLEKAVNIGVISMSDLDDYNTARDKLGFPAKDNIRSEEEALDPLQDEVSPTVSPDTITGDETPPQTKGQEVEPAKPTEVASPEAMQASLWRLVKQWWKDKRLSSGRLLGSAPSLDALKKLLKDRWSWDIVEFKPTGDKTWDVYAGKGKVDGLTVELKKGRYRLLMS